MRGATRFGDGAQNPPAVVRRTGHAGFKLVGAITGEDQVGVRINEAGHHGGPVDVDHLVGLGGAVTRPDPHDAALVDDHGRVLQPSHHRLVAQGWIIGRQFTNVGNEPRGHSALAHGYSHAALTGRVVGEVVAGVHVPNDTGARVVTQHPGQFLCGQRRAVGHAHLASV